MIVKSVWAEKTSIWNGEKIVPAMFVRVSMDDECGKELMAILKHKAEGYLASKRYEDAKMLIDGILNIQKAIQEIYKGEQVLEVINRSRQEAQEQSYTAEELDQIENELFPPRKAPEA